MKKLMIGLALMASSTTFATTNLTCGIFNGENYSLMKKVVIDIDQDQVYESIFTSESQTFSITKAKGTLTLGFSDAEGTNKTVISEAIIRMMKGSQSIGVISHLANDESKNHTAVCYQTGTSENTPFDKSVTL
jgi:hypothetical protein